MIVDLPTLHKLEQLSCVVSVSGSLRRKEFIKVLRRRALVRLNESAAAVGEDLALPEEGIVYTPLPGVPDAWGCNKYRCRWAPAGLAAELLGGPKDGMLLQLTSAREVIVFQVLAPDWRQCAGEDPDGVIPKLRYVYRLTGFNLGNGAFVYTADEPARV